MSAVWYCSHYCTSVRWHLWQICHWYQQYQDDTGVNWKKSSIRKILIIFLKHLCAVELTYRSICSFMFTFRCQQSDIVPIIAPVSVDICCTICHRYQQYQRYWLQNIPPVWHRWQICHQRCTFTCKYLREVSKKLNLKWQHLFGGLRGRWKKPEAKNFVTLSL